MSRLVIARMCMVWPFSGRPKRTAPPLRRAATEPELASSYEKLFVHAENCCPDGSTKCQRRIPARGLSSGGPSLPIEAEYLACMSRVTYTV